MKRINLKKIVAAVLACLTLTSLTACGDKGDNGGGKTTELVVWFGTDNYDQKNYEELVSVYNQGQGKTDGVFIKAQYKGLTILRRFLPT